MVKSERKSRSESKTPPRETVYKATADRIVALIEGGTFRVGDRLPSVRRLSRQFKIAPGTVLHTYRVLEDRGIIQARPQSGFYVRPRPRSLPEPVASTPHSRAHRPTVGEMVMRMSRMAAQNDVVQLGHATPHSIYLPTQRLNRISAVIARRSSKGFNSYDLPPGCRELRVQIARQYVTAGCDLSPDDLITTCGCQEALGLCLRAATKPGDIVAVDSPTFYGILQAIEMLGLRALEIPTDPRTGVDLEALENALTGSKVKACLFVTNCHNPLGFVMPEQRKRVLVELLTRHDIPLIEDDTYGDLAFADERPSVCKSLDADGRVMLCSSFSKTIAPGARVGWCAPGRYRAEVERLKFCNTIATATLPQLALADYCANGGYTHHLRKLRRAYADQMQQMTQWVQQYFPFGTRATRPVGGHVLWIELPSNSPDATALFEAAAARRISIAPGPLFSTAGGYRKFLRLNCAAPSDASLERAIQTLGGLAHSMGSAIDPSI